MVRLEPAAGPSVSLFELNAKQKFHFVKSAVFDTSLAMIRSELEGHNGVGRNRRLNFQAGARWGDVLQNRPLAIGWTELGIPLNLHKIGAKVSIFSSLRHYD